jgi:hypothetical protein
VDRLEGEEAAPRGDEGVFLRGQRAPHRDLRLVAGLDRERPRPKGTMSQAVELNVTGEASGG